MAILTENSMRLMERSMDYLWAKQAAHLDNIANAETPGYKVKTVTFEEELSAKLNALTRAGAGERRYARREIRKVLEDARWDVFEDEEDTRMDGNGVNVTEQSVEAVRTAYQLQTVMRSISNDLALISRAIGAN